MATVIDVERCPSLAQTVPLSRAREGWGEGLTWTDQAVAGLPRAESSAVVSSISSAFTPCAEPR